MIHTRMCYHHASALVGAMAWLLLLALLPAEPPTILWISQLLLLAVLMFVPLALGLAAASRSAHIAACWRLAVRVQPAAAAAAVAAFLLPAGVVAGVLALGWLLFAGIVALLGLTRFFTNDRHDAAELCINVS